MGQKDNIDTEILLNLQAGPFDDIAMVLRESGHIALQRVASDRTMEGPVIAPLQTPKDGYLYHIVIDCT